MSKYLNIPAATVPADIRKTRQESNSKLEPVTGVKERGVLSLIRGVVDCVFAMIIRSSVLPVPPAPLSIIRILNPVPTIPREASLFCGIVAQRVADGVSVSVVAQAAIVPRGQALGINTQFAPAQKVPDNQGEPT